MVTIQQHLKQKVLEDGSIEIFYTLHSIEINDKRRSMWVQIGNNKFIPVENGVMIYYPCGTKRFISNSRYE